MRTINFFARKLLLLALLFTVALAARHPASAQARYTAIEITDPDGSPVAGGPINNRGQVAGSVNQYVVGQGYLPYVYLWDITNGFHLLNLPPLTATSMNDAGTITGVSGTNGYYQAFVYSAGKLTLIDRLPGGTTSSAYGIDSDGTVVGFGDTVLNNVTYGRAFIYDTVLGLRELGTLTPGGSSAALDINSGRIVGVASTASGDNHAFLYSDGVMRDLGTLGGVSSYASGINASGQVVGFANTNDIGVTHAFLYSGGIMHDLGTRSDITNSAATKINRSGQVLGYFSGLGTVPFLWTPDTPNGTTGKLETLADLMPTGWEIREASYLNDAGQIVAYGKHNGVPSTFLLTPINSLSVTAAKLSVPTFVRDFGGNYLITLYFKGSGKGDISGTWQLDGVPFAQEHSLGWDLTSGSWTPGPTISIPRSVMLGNHSLKFVFDAAPTVETKTIESSVTGFDPAVNGWHFLNTFNSTNVFDHLLGTSDGLCLGMSREARRIYRNGGQIPADTVLPSRQRNPTLFWQIYWSHVEGLFWYRFVGQLRLLSQFDFNQELNDETYHIAERMKRSMVSPSSLGDPPVVLLSEKPRLAQHAVIATGAFTSDDIFLPTAPDQKIGIRRFYFSDPNRVGEFTQADVYNEGTSWNLSYSVPGTVLSVHYMTEFRLD